MDKRFDVVALGELLIDFTENGQSGQGNSLFEANPGGAPCNVLAMLSKLGKRCAFIGKVGDDMFGKLLRETAESVGIDCGGLVTDENARTTLAFVKNTPDGDRDFSFFRSPGADMLLSEEDLKVDLLKDTAAFHFGSLSLTHEGVRAATRKALALAKSAGAVISFDPNLRPPLWNGNLNDAKEQIAWGLSQCHLAKIADNELLFLTGESDFYKGAEIILAQYPNIRLLCVTAGADGSYAFYGGEKVFVPSFRLGGTIETTGAGDTFCACVLYHVLERGLDGFNEDSLRGTLRFANAAAYLVTTKKGAIRSMPERSDVETILREH